MDISAGKPAGFREIVAEDLKRAARLIVKIQDEIDWQLRIATPEGDYAIAVSMPDGAERQAMLQRLHLFMVWKGALAFTLAVETSEPDAVYAVGVSRAERVNCLSAITRRPRPWKARNFAGIEWLPPETIDPALLALLPVGPRAVTPKDISGLMPWFGEAGKFPAVHLKSGEIRGV
jgi:hypothetical protein